MTLTTVLFSLRVVSGVLLLTFIATLCWLLWRDYRVVARELESRQRRRGRLVVTQSEGLPIKAGTSYPLLPLTSVGRGLTNTIALNDTFASAEHALFTLRGGQWWLEDRGSSNGTLLNGALLEEPTVISAGDVVSVGRVALRVELD